ncbi:hypothetical protein EJ06DRAFT_521468 [Trichodelitschia bisporula]|uniref:AA9 family lytic polysaccharide monooxygenase n=1 Tax=Trichodelitschia bisporula TaxID=703511 RepID=A0A6G1HXI8_9PEZI|nr:hypothetical protein EJ06DRAFT_521468 [Trichodelitschia bisporula]
MKTAHILSLGAVLLSYAAEAHYIFQAVSTSGAKGAEYQYVRHNTNRNSPVVDLASLDLRCNVGGSSGASTETLPVAAGSSVTWTADTAVYHQGPVSFYMTKVANAAEADGSTPWFKIKDIGPTFPGGSWEKCTQKSFVVQIPKCLPSGDYLLRIQQLGIHNPGGAPQFYVNCAQVKVTGGGNGNPSPLVSIPGAFKKTDPGYTANIYNNFKNYSIPGPPVWTC